MTKDTELKSEVAEFYKNAKILITGGTGFVGKVLISKLLHSCHQVDCIYMLVRVKKGKDPQTRIAGIFDEVMFEPLKAKYPGVLKKVVCIPGDISCTRLGMSDEHYEFLRQEVTHVIHSAATVRFNEKLKTALKINVFGTCEILNFCNQCTQLKVLVHVSTAYVQSYKDITTEKIKESSLSREQALTIMNSLTEEQVDLITPSLLQNWPNSYAFTKAIGECCVLEMAKGYPVVIFRPAVVSGSVREPVKGWIDNLYGPTGLVLGAAVGLVRIMYGNVNVDVHFVPVDMCVNALLCSAWETNREYYENQNKKLTYLNHQVKPTPKVYNFVNAKNNLISIGSYMDIGLRVGMQYPVSQCIWFYALTITKYKLLFNTLTLFLHFVPAFFMDLALLILGKKRQFIKMYKKIHEFSLLAGNFALHRRDFANENTLNLWNSLNEVDKKIFFFDMGSFDWKEYLKISFLGIRLYLLKESEETLPRARKKLFILWMIHRTIQIIIVGLFFWWIHKYFFTFSRLSENTFLKATLMPKEL